MQLIAENLVLVRGARAVIDGLSFRVAGGEALVLTGPNGAGKTTLIRALAGFLAPRSGSIRIEGGAGGLEAAEQVHYVGHVNGLKANLSVAENLGFWAAFLGAHSQAGGIECTSRALARVGLLELAGIPAGYLSAGQKRRLGLARLLVADRPIWLLDEPTVSLDASSVSMIAAIVNAHVVGGGIAIAATHLALGLEAARELKLGTATRNSSADGLPA